MASNELEGLQRLKKNLAAQPQSLEDLWLSQPGLWQELGWYKSQLKLWLRCQTDVHYTGDSSEAALFEIEAQAGSNQPDLGEELARILKGVGRPMPVSQLKNKLPAGLLATEIMIKAAAAKHPHLVLAGPMIKLIQ